MESKISAFMDKKTASMSYSKTWHPTISVIIKTLTAEFMTTNV